MGGLSWWHWLIILGVGLLLFGGRGKLSGLMGDAAKGVKAFKDGLKEDPSTTPKTEEPTSVLPPVTEAEKEDLKR
jgi:sec-independent protein translocase protein TatA